jgi:NADH dehydrogenase
VKDFDGTQVTIADGTKYNTETFIWAAGVTGAPVKGLNGASLIEKSNRYKVDAFSRVAGFEHIFALGDIALMETKDYPHGHPQVAQPAMQQGRWLAKNIKALLQGKEMTAFSYFDKGTLATIGRNKAVADIKNWTFGGLFAWVLWMFVHLWFLIGFRNRMVTFFNWVYNYINYDRAARLIIRPFKKSPLGSTE